MKLPLPLAEQLAVASLENIIKIYLKEGSVRMGGNKAHRRKTVSNDMDTMAFVENGHAAGTSSVSERDASNPFGPGSTGPVRTRGSSGAMYDPVQTQKDYGAANAKAALDNSFKQTMAAAPMTRMDLIPLAAGVAASAVAGSLVTGADITSVAITFSGALGAASGYLISQYTVAKVPASIQMAYPYILAVGVPSLVAGQLDMTSGALGVAMVLGVKAASKY